jgi:Gluconate 2-dehydrogenase subunit 3
MRTTNTGTPNTERNVNTNREASQSGNVNDSLITRRAAIVRVSALFGGVALIDSDRLLAAMPDAAAQTHAAAQGVGTFTPADIAFLDEVAETILPQTDTPGAKAARTGAFMALMVTEAYSYRHQAIFRDGMRQIEEACRRDFNAPFQQASPGQRLALLQALDAERQAEIDARDDARTLRAPALAPLGPDAPVHYFRLMKELALLGYFTSEIGYRQAMRYIESPGRYDPCAPYAPGEKVWAPHA